LLLSGWSLLSDSTTTSSLIIVRHPITVWRPKHNLVEKQVSHNLGLRLSTHKFTFGNKSTSLETMSGWDLIAARRGGRLEHTGFEQ
jgi:hypothetical protein